MENQNGKATEGVLAWGETVIQPQEEVEFSYSYYLHENQHVLTVRFDIPLRKSVRELTYRLLASHSIPCYLEDGKDVTFCLLVASICFTYSIFHISVT